MEHNEKIKQDLQHVYWIAGGSCAGKTTVSGILAKRYGFTLYESDRYLFGDHKERATPKKYPLTFRMNTRTQKEGSAAWFWEGSPEEIMQRFIDWGQEDFEMVIEDLYNLPGNKYILVDTFAGVTELVYKITSPQKAIFMVAEEEFQRDVLSKRHKRYWFNESLKASSDPKRALKNSIDFNLGLTKYVVTNVRKLGGKLIITNKNSSIEKNIEIIKDHFKLAD